MAANSADRARAAALDQIDQTERNFKRALMFAGVLEAMFLGIMLWLVDLKDRTHLLILVSSIGTYGMGVAAVFALGAHLNRKFQMLLRAIES